MIKFTEQYFWNFVFLTFFFVLVVLAAIILETESRFLLADITWLDAALVTLGSWRLTRFIISDSTTKFFREQFYDLKKTTRSLTLEVPAQGPRRTILEILLNPWNVSMGVAALVIFTYALTSYMVYPLALLALSGVVSLFELGASALKEKGSKE